KYPTKRVSSQRNSTLSSSKAEIGVIPSMTKADHETASYRQMSPPHRLRATNPGSFLISRAEG
ncbi:hypothetical protein, partial [Acidisphaera sp. L21]|uniref:hypothetical protein n=1 Tax=Acidisphaera sp. L21 TaxID=1641851 RepID=UPI001C20690B